MGREQKITTKLKRLTNFSPGNVFSSLKGGDICQPTFEACCCSQAVLLGRICSGVGFRGVGGCWDSLSSVCVSMFFFFPFPRGMLKVIY